MITLGVQRGISLFGETTGSVASRPETTGSVACRSAAPGSLFQSTGGTETSGSVASSGGCGANLSAVA